MKIIIVDDEIKIRNGLSKLISNCKDKNYEITGVFADAFSMLNSLNTLAADVLITDIKMPVINGLELISKIREKNQDIKIIILSGYGNFTYAQEAIKLGVYRYLLKPTNPKELLSALNELAFQNHTINTVQSSAPDDLKTVKNIIIQQAVNYIEINYNKKISLKKTAEYLHISPNYFCELFKKFLNKNFIDYVNEYRIEKSKTFLKDISLTVHDISRLVGYSDSRYFCSIFKKKNGITPTEYRNSHY